MRETRIRLLGFQTARGSISPAALRHKAIPNFDLLVRWAATRLEAPLQNLVIRAAREDPCLKRVKRNAEESADTIIKSPLPRDHADMPALRQGPVCMETNFV